MRKWYVLYLEMANSSLYVYMHIIFPPYKKLQVITEQEMWHLISD